MACTRDIFLVLLTILFITLPSPILADTAGSEDPYAAVVNGYGDITADLVTKIIRIESGGNPKARSNKGAMGLMQLMPATVDFVHKLLELPDNKLNPWNPEHNIYMGIVYLKWLHERYDRNIRLTLIGYNAGPKVADTIKNGTRNNLYKDTRTYLERIFAVNSRNMNARPVSNPEPSIENAAAKAGNNTVHTITAFFIPELTDPVSLTNRSQTARFNTRTAPNPDRHISADPGIATGNAKAKDLAAKAEKTAPSGADEDYIYVIVKRGDTLSKIASLYTGNAQNYKDDGIQIISLSDSTRTVSKEHYNLRRLQIGQTVRIHASLLSALTTT